MDAWLFTIAAPIVAFWCGLRVNDWMRARDAEIAELAERRRWEGMCARRGFGWIDSEDEFHWDEKAGIK